jgi:hypothetical protein
MKKGWILILVVLLALVLALPASAGPGANGLNAQFIFWQERQNVIHIFVFNDDGRAGAGPATVDAGDPIILGYEVSDVSIEAIQDHLTGPDFDLTLSVDGGPEVSVRDLFQSPFDSSTSRPRWSWDHDGDGRGDGDGDSIGDWSGPVAFFRYWHPGFASGVHTFTFTTYDFGAPTVDVITVNIVP